MLSVQSVKAPRHIFDGACLHQITVEIIPAARDTHAHAVCYRVRAPIAPHSHLAQRDGRSDNNSAEPPAMTPLIAVLALATAPPHPNPNGPPAECTPAGLPMGTSHFSFACAI